MNRIESLLEHGCTYLTISPPALRKSLAQCIRENMVKVPPLGFWNENSSYFSSIFHGLTQPRPKISHKPVCGLKISILRVRKIFDVDLLHATKYGHTYIFTLP